MPICWPLAGTKKRFNQCNSIWNVLLNFKILRFDFAIMDKSCTRLLSKDDYDPRLQKIRCRVSRPFTRCCNNVIFTRLTAENQIFSLLCFKAKMLKCIKHTIQYTGGTHETKMFHCTCITLDYHLSWLHFGIPPKESKTYNDQEAVNIGSQDCILVFGVSSVWDV